MSWARVLDGIDVVVRRGRDQHHAGGGVAQARDHLGDLEAGQLPAFAGLGALSDLDLDLAALVQVFGRDAEAARGDLLHRRIGIVAVGQRTVAGAILAAFAGDRLGADPVHGDVQRAVRFGTEGAERHPRRDEAFADGVDALHLVQPHAGGVGAVVQQVAKLDRRQGADGFGERLIQVVAAGVAGGLQGVDHARLEGVRLARAPGLVEPANRQGDG